MPNKLEIKINHADLRKLIDELPEKSSQITSLFYFENLKTREISERLNLSISVTRQRLGIGNYLLRKKTGCAEFLKAQEILYGKKNVR